MNFSGSTILLIALSWAGYEGAYSQAQDSSTFLTVSTLQLQGTILSGREVYVKESRMSVGMGNSNFGLSTRRSIFLQVDYARSKDPSFRTDVAHGDLNDVSIELSYELSQ